MKFFAFVAWSCGVSLAMTVSAAHAASGRDVYDKTCSVCHVSGVGGAPKFGDRGAWAPRIARGKAELMVSVREGKGAMPGKNFYPKLTEAEMSAAVDYMLNAAR